MEAEGGSLRDGYGGYETAGCQWVAGQGAVLVREVCLRAELASERVIQGAAKLAECMALRDAGEKVIM